MGNDMIATKIRIIKSHLIQKYYYVTQLMPDHH